MCILYKSLKIYSFILLSLEIETDDWGNQDGVHSSLKECSGGHLENDGKDAVKEDDYPNKLQVRVSWGKL